MCRYDRQADIVLRGFSGYNSRWALDMLRTSLLAPCNTDIYSMATIFFGANDAVLSGDPQHCPLEEYQSNISSMVQTLREHNPDIQLILITPGTVDHTQWSTRHPDQVAQYATALREVGVTLHVPVVDLWQGDIAFDLHHPVPAVSSSTTPPVPVPGNDDGNDFSDGLHLSRSGNRKVYTGVMNVITESYPNSLPDPEVLHFPSWKEMAGKPAAETRDILRSWKWNSNC